MSAKDMALGMQHIGRENNHKAGEYKRSIGDCLYRWTRQLEEDSDHLRNETLNAVARMREALMWLDLDVQRNHRTLKPYSSADSGDSDANSEGSDPRSL